MLNANHHSLLTTSHSQLTNKKQRNLSPTSGVKFFTLPMLENAIPVEFKTLNFS